MKRHLSLSEAMKQRLLSGRRRARARRGSTLLVVMALLGMLTLLSLLYFTFATQEQANATNFSDAAKRLDEPGDDIDALFDATVRQIIQGGSESEKASAMWGGRFSLLFSMIGHDLQPFSGTGVNLILTDPDYDPFTMMDGPLPTDLYADQDRDGLPDSVNPGYDLRELNDSPAARYSATNSQLNLFQRDLKLLPAPDVEYTAPDHNNPLIAYDSWTWDLTRYPPRPVRAVKPSLHRPEFFRTGIQGVWKPVAGWATAPGYGGRSFRPHPEHLYVWRNGENLTPERRFLNAANPADTALIAALPGTSGGFPFNVDLDGDGVFNEQGVWDWDRNVAMASQIVMDEDVDGDGVLDPSEDLDGDGILDVGEDANLNGFLDLAEDVNGNGVLDKKPFEFDVDTDQDGVRDANWNDFDLPVMVRPSDNATYVPLVAIRVLDVSGKLNPNAHGNTMALAFPAVTSSAGSNLGAGFDLHMSSSGLSPSEINLSWALDTLPSEAASVSDHTTAFHAPSTQRHLANMEQVWLSKGRIEYTTPRQIHAGRYGEANRLWQVLAAGSMGSVLNSQPELFPFAGIWDSDDNQNANEGGLVGVLGGQSLPFRHPLPLGGTGGMWPGWPGGNPKQFDLVSFSVEDLNFNGVLDGGEDGANGGIVNGALDPNPMRYVRYTGIGVGDDGSGIGNVGWKNFFGGRLLVNEVIGANGANYVAGALRLLDDPTELTLDDHNALRPYDEKFDAKDTLPLYMIKSDRDKVGATSRLFDLMPGNLVPNISLPDGGQQQLNVGKRLTTESWDLKTFALPRIPGVRDWEFNVDTDNDGLLEFPPQFSGAVANSPNDPFRPQLRRLLTTELGNTNQIQHAMRLSVNELLDVERRPGQPVNPYTDPLAYRPLTAHSIDSSITTLPTVASNPTYPPTTEREKEFWAIRDRQQMARDIYVLLYTFCGGNDSANVTTTSGLTVYPAPTRRQMAQFAVNVVDALDRDNVMTAFEFDNNLVNGWGLDDDPTTTTGDTAAAGERDVVIGVESQELTFSEVMWAWQAQQGANEDRTPWDDSTNDNNFLQFELRSTSPQATPLALPVSTTSITGLWRIHRDDDGDGNLDATENMVTLLNGAGSVPAAGLFVIATADSTPVGSSSLYIDTAGTASMGTTRDDELVAPNRNPATVYVGTTLPPEADLDLLHATHTGRFNVTNNGSGDFLSRTNNPGNGTGPADSTLLRLERRLNPNLPLLSLGANPFVTVDTFSRVSRRTLKIEGMMSQADAASRLQKIAPFDTSEIASQERREPLNRGGVALSPGIAPSAHLNTLGQNNMPLNPSNLVQPHFDRDFASVIELFEIPLQGPNQLTANMFNSRFPAESPTGFTPRGQLERGGPFTFGAAVILTSEDRDEDGVLDLTEDTNGNGILDPGEDTNSNGRLDLSEDVNGNGVLDFPGSEDVNRNGMLDPGEDTNGNMTLDAGNSMPYRFHRLLSLVEVPTRTHRQLGDPLKQTRIPGTMNLNAIDDPRALAALLDSRQVMDAPERLGLGDLNGNNQLDTGLPDRSGEPPEADNNTPNGALDPGEDIDGSGALDNPGRDWWIRFLLARDGVDPASNLLLPMSGVSRPFRDAGLMLPNAGADIFKSSVPDTLFRGFLSLPTERGRGMFDLATEAEFRNGGVDPHLKNRLLSKIYGNSTTRGNVFLVTVTIGMFECVELSNGAVRIGGHMDVDGDGQKDTHRAFFLIDRTLAEEAYDKGSGTFDWKKLIKARQRIN